MKSKWTAFVVSVLFLSFDQQEQNGLIFFFSSILDLKVESKEDEEEKKLYSIQRIKRFVYR